MRFMNKQCITAWHPFTDVKVEDKEQQCASQGYKSSLLSPNECYEDEHNCCLEFVDCNLGTDEHGANHPAVLVLLRHHAHDAQRAGARVLLRVLRALQDGECACVCVGWGGGEGGCVYVPVYVRVRACVRACVFVCMYVCLSACVRVRVSGAYPARTRPIAHIL
ncbi:hypothetical protein T492DRAFT_155797 [Pavlovales sp. CCMP2436]|nr:hypothetical protein T492DRAFT_155797 [Pavlovales sp. CCMP2436]